MTTASQSTEALQALDLIASVATRKLPAVEIVAYGGGAMTVPGWGVIAIDLAGLELGRVPKRVIMNRGCTGSLSGVR